MALYNSDGSLLTQSTFLSGTHSASTSTTTHEVKQHVWEDFLLDGATSTYSRRLKFRKGEVITQQQVDDMFLEPTITDISPATGAIAGGTVVTITGTNLGNTTGVTFGGTAGTALTNTSSTEVTVTTPAHASGAVDVVLTTVAGPVTETGGYTYA